MDFGAVIQASDDILYQLGLVRKGDILSLRGFCEGKLEEKANADQKDARDETKRKLLAELFSQKKKKQYYKVLRVQVYSFYTAKK